MRVGLGRSAGRWPERIAGTPEIVPSATVVLFRYQVELFARDPKLGKRAELTSSFRSIRAAAGASSNTTRKTGVPFPLSSTAFVWPSAGKRMSLMGERKRKSTITTSGAGLSQVRTLRTAAWRA